MPFVPLVAWILEMLSSGWLSPIISQLKSSALLEDATCALLISKMLNEFAPDG
jgi:hypothetical protein